MNDSLAYSYDDRPTFSSGLDIVKNEDRNFKITKASNDDLFNTQNKLYPVFAIIIDGELKPLKFAIQLRIRYEDGFYFAENEAFHIYGNGESIAEALKSAALDISYFYNYYLNLDDDELVGKGLELKRLFSQIL